MFVVPGIERCLFIENVMTVRGAEGCGHILRPMGVFKEFWDWKYSLVGGVYLQFNAAGWWKFRVNLHDGGF
jgi:hypothetical protein